MHSSYTPLKFMESLSYFSLSFYFIFSIFSPNNYFNFLKNFKISLLKASKFTSYDLVKNSFL